MSVNTSNITVSRRAARSSISLWTDIGTGLSATLTNNITLNGLGGVKDAIYADGIVPGTT